MWASGGIAAAALVLGLVAFVAGARAEPTSWGLLVAAPGLILDAACSSGFAVHGLPKPLTGSGGLDALAHALFPWPTILVLIGLCMLALRKAWWTWASSRPGRTSGAAVGVILAALALFGAVEVFRGADATPAASLAS